MADWDDLRGELDTWQRTERTATFWWRDDDATCETPALDRLLALRFETAVPLALAVIPAKADATLARRIQRERDVAVLQHGYAHHNHATMDQPKCELGRHRPRHVIIDELAAGRARLRRMFAGCEHAVIVPPWHCIDPNILLALRAAGYTGISVNGPRRRLEVIPGLRQVNVHADMIDWHKPGRIRGIAGAGLRIFGRHRRPRRPFVGLATALDQVMAHLAARRNGEADMTEPTGLVTHHLDLDSSSWRFTEDFVRHTRSHPAVRWLGATDLFAPTSVE